MSKTTQHVVTAAIHTRPPCKTILTDTGLLDITVPRDRDAGSTDRPIYLALMQAPAPTPRESVVSALLATSRRRGPSMPTADISVLPKVVCRQCLWSSAAADKHS